MIRCLVVDDEPLAQNLLKNYIGKIASLELAGATSDVFAALDMAQQQKVDLIFLDVQMPELTGIQFMKILAGKCKVILTTAYEEYALQAFDLDVVDYLLKPFSFERFAAAVQKARERLQPLLRESNTAEHLFIKTEYKIVRVAVKDIRYMESMRDYVSVYTENERILTLQSLRAFEEQLRHTSLMRVHKSYIVNLDRIDKVERRRIVIGDKYIPIGETYQDEVKKRLQQGNSSL
ncbi:MAG: DNA-binding response regulator [Sphingobacteriales bacterium SCN 48-20]|uniref:LytR/AlgR family response regulator transcription factor n=1 Tax=Terrimonas ferruginea TaxID=249 RepID=UPI00086EB70E|nr:LytTR family DNA-binding domain-containing protein [Terrimonas ferruginea]MBN8782207.1 response regulator transcription factor [Terrimonas ferruginea]ODT91448.1 MAG: DNA-binding response regulator [Sphingobacteriales bacterium SCN 48-20]OJW42739.1 MAG: DNA-binding response regulator [Sphingobacteriales bacterium 48-107]